MHARRPTAALALALAAGLALGAPACAPDPGRDPASAAGGAEADADPDAAFAALRACPGGDLAWIDAFKAARDAGRLEEARTVAVELAEVCAAGAWQPAWLEARVELALERPDPARERFAAALDAARAADDPTGIARAADQLGWIGFVTGARAEGRARYEEAIAAAIRAGRDDLEGFARNNFAGLLVDDGDFAGAVEQLERAEAALARAGRADAALGLAYNRATLELELGDAFGARDTLERVHAEAAEVGDVWTVNASAVVLGNLHLALEQPDAARDWHARVDEAIPDLWRLARLGLGRAALARGDIDEAREILDAAVRDAREAEAAVAGMTEIFLAEAELRARRFGDAEERLQRWIDAPDPPAEVAWGARWMLGRSKLVQGRPAEAVGTLSVAVRLLEEQGAALDPLDSGLRFLRQRREPYVDLAVALGRDHDPRTNTAQRVADVVSRAKARALRRALHESEVERDRERESATAGGGSPGPGLAATRSALEPGELILDYLLGDEAGIVLAIERDATRAFVLEGRRTVAPAARAWRAALQAGASGAPEAREAAEALRRALLDPVAAELARARRLWIVPDAELALIPLETLPDPAPPAALGDRLDVGLLPLAGPPARLRGDRAPLLLAGNPVFDGDASGDGEDLGALPWSAFELSALRETWGDARATLVSGPDLTAEAIAGRDLSRFRTIHLATHAVASTADPRRCGVILSGGERLGLDRIVALDLDGAVVVLSACRTGEGELIPGEGIVGLGWAFLRAGASAVVASLWSVDDAESARLMAELHRRLEAGDDPVAALAAARRARAAETPGIAARAPFVAIVRPGPQEIR